MASPAIWFTLFLRMQIQRIVNHNNDKIVKYTKFIHLKFSSASLVLSIAQWPNLMLIVRLLRNKRLLQLQV